MHRGKILIVSGDLSFGEILKSKVDHLGYDVLQVIDAIEGLAVLKQEKPLLFVLEVECSSVDGLSLIHQIRHSKDLFAHVPILAIYPTYDYQAKINALEYGVDVVISKPFSVKEIVSQVKSLLRMGQALMQNVESPQSLQIDEGEILHIGDITLLPESREVKIHNVIVHLTPIEFEMLYCLTQNIGKTISPNTLLKEIWGYSPTDDIETIRVHIRHLRQRLDEAANKKNKKDNQPKKKYIRTIYGKGYQLIPEGFTYD